MPVSGKTLSGSEGMENGFLRPCLVVVSMDHFLAILTKAAAEQGPGEYALTGRRCREMASRLPAQFTNRKGSCG